jgi:uncharacterized RDD family membrane protein YckC
MWSLDFMLARFNMVSLCLYCNKASPLFGHLRCLPISIVIYLTSLFQMSAEELGFNIWHINTCLSLILNIFPCNVYVFTHTYGIRIQGLAHFFLWIYFLRSFQKTILVFWGTPPETKRLSYRVVFEEMELVLIMSTLGHRIVIKFHIENCL